jgi:hypothetical protein
MIDEKCIQNFGQKTEREISLGIPTRKWEDNIRTDLREIGWKSVDWIHVAQDRDQWRDLVKMITNLR